MKKFRKTMEVTGGIMILLLVVGALANGYGAGIPLVWITNSSIPIGLVVGFLAWAELI